MTLDPDTCRSIVLWKIFLNDSPLWDPMPSGDLQNLREIDIWSSILGMSVTSEFWMHQFCRDESCSVLSAVVH